jgi:protein involved in temperature-dependent protein secretion
MQRQMSEEMPRGRKFQRPRQPRCAKETRREWQAGILQAVAAVASGATEGSATAKQSPPERTTHRQNLPASHWLVFLHVGSTSVQTQHVS